MRLANCTVIVDFLLSSVDKRPDLLGLLRRNKELELAIYGQWKSMHK